MSRESTRPSSATPTQAFPRIEGPAEPTPAVFLIGAGAVGAALAAKLTRAGVPVLGVHGRESTVSRTASAAAGVLGSTGDLPAMVAQANVVLVSVRDTRIPEITQRLLDQKLLRKGQILLHTSGARAAGEVLGAARGHVLGLGTLHPLIAVTDAPGTLDNLKGAAFGIEGDEEARVVARRLVGLMEGRALELSAATMALYHAGAVVASNYAVALADLARSLLVAAGIPEADALPALTPLMHSAVRNLIEVGLPAALTGPVVRGDVVTVKWHLAALERSAPACVDVYRRLGREVLRIARQREPDLDDAAASRMAALFGGGAESTAPAKPDVAKAAAGKKRK